MAKKKSGLPDRNARTSILEQQDAPDRSEQKAQQSAEVGMPTKSSAELIVPDEEIRSGSKKLTCVKCNKKITSTYLCPYVAQGDTTSVMHEECFCCAYDGAPLAGGMYYEHGGEVFCDEHFPLCCAQVRFVSRVYITSSLSISISISSNSNTLPLLSLYFLPAVRHALHGSIPRGLGQALARRSLWMQSL
jgi:hypothetical protein